MNENKNRYRGDSMEKTEPQEKFYCLMKIDYLIEQVKNGVEWEIMVEELQRLRREVKNIKERESYNRYRKNGGNENV